MRFRSWLTLCLLLFGLAFADPVPQDPVALRHVETPDGADIYMANRLGNDMTVTLEFTEQQNVEGNPPFPCTMTIPGHKEVLMSRVRKTGAPWNYRYMYYWNFGSIHARHDDSVVYTLPYPSGRTMHINQGFHGRLSHTGDDEYAVDFSHAEGTPVLCAREGVVVHAEERYTQGGSSQDYRPYSNVVRVRHSDGTIGQYDHMRHNSVEVEEGQTVRRGQLIGLAGRTGFTTGPHLHFVVYGAKDGHSRISYPIRFHVAGSNQPVELVEGSDYTAP